ncbi:MAG: hypothetical protein J0L47_08490 [Flavobacteriales bacterium]|nr:hypothetical protein [Flavobacteriales bacterium]MCA0390255.1 hypothetical protein [Bacteroidota bacterium]
MKKIINFLLVGVLFSVISCQRTDDSITPPSEQKDNFFNLNVGNKWVYKTYANPDFTDPQSPYTYTGRIDSVSIVGNVTIQGLTFAKERTKIFYSGLNTNGSVIYHYLRVNSKGHLVSYPATDNVQVTETGGTVRHPGKDMSYNYSSEVIEGILLGHLFYKLAADKNILLDDVQYSVSPYEGKFTPLSTQTNLLPKTQEVSYKSGLGKVKDVCHAIYGKNFTETRLVSSHIVSP